MANPFRLNNMQIDGTETFSFWRWLWMSYSLLEWFSVISLILNFSRLLLIKAGLNRLKLIKATGWHKFNLSRLFSNPAFNSISYWPDIVQSSDKIAPETHVSIRKIFSKSLACSAPWMDRIQLAPSSRPCPTSIIRNHGCTDTPHYTLISPHYTPPTVQDHRHTDWAGPGSRATDQVSPVSCPPSAIAVFRSWLSGVQWATLANRSHWAGRSGGGGEGEDRGWWGGRRRSGRQRGPKFRAAPTAALGQWPAVALAAGPRHCQTPQTWT